MKPLFISVVVILMHEMLLTPSFGQQLPPASEIEQIPRLNFQTCKYWYNCKTEKEKKWFKKQWNVTAMKCFEVLGEGKEISRSGPDEEYSWYVYQNALWRFRIYNSEFLECNVFESDDFEYGQ